MSSEVDENSLIIDKSSCRVDSSLKTLENILKILSKSYKYPNFESLKIYEIRDYNKTSNLTRISFSFSYNNFINFYHLISLMKSNQKK